MAARERVEPQVQCGCSKSRAGAPNQVQGGRRFGLNLRAHRHQPIECPAGVTVIEERLPLQKGQRHDAGVILAYQIYPALGKEICLTPARLRERHIYEHPEPAARNSSARVAIHHFLGHPARTL